LCLSLPPFSLFVDVPFFSDKLHLYPLGIPNVSI
jgi:hypothetical protein